MMMSLPQAIAAQQGPRFGAGLYPAGRFPTGLFRLSSPVQGAPMKIGAQQARFFPWPMQYPQGKVS